MGTGKELERAVVTDNELDVAGSDPELTRGGPGFTDLDWLLVPSKDL